MRMWKGLDREDNSNLGEMTLFVESTNPDIDILLPILKENSDIHAIYFGAGEVDILNWEFIRDLDLLRDYVILLECSINNIIPEELSENFATIIVRFNVRYTKDNLFIKLRTLDSVLLTGIDKFNDNLITEVVNGQYLNDVELYVDEGD